MLFLNNALLRQNTLLKCHAALLSNGQPCASRLFAACLHASYTSSPRSACSPVKGFERPSL